MKILVLLSRFPFPLEKGDKLRAFNQIVRLSKKHKIFLYTISDRSLSETDYIQLSPYCEKIEVFHLSKWGIIFNLFKVLFSSLPFQVSYFYHSKITRNLNRMIEENKPDVIYYQLIRTAQYSFHFPEILSS